MVGSWNGVLIRDPLFAVILAGALARIATTLASKGVDLLSHAAIYLGVCVMVKLDPILRAV